LARILLEHPPTQPKTMAPMLALHDWLSSEDGSAVSDEDGACSSEDGAPSAPEPGLATGTLVDEVYRIVAPLGSGAMGTVYLAHDETLDRSVAIKVARFQQKDATFRARFLAEARAMARVKHPNVLSVFAFGEHEGSPYFVMDFVKGGTLQEWLDQCEGPPDLDLVFRILDGMCRGVSAIHAAHTIHQDIKPDNVLLDRNLRPRIADLGLAVEQRGGQATAREFVGTPAYMAPEVAFPRALDPPLRARADVYALACVAYQLLTGRPPFDGSGNMGMLLQHAMKTVVAPSTLRAGLSPAIDQVILSGLAKDPRARTATAEDFRRGLMAARRQMRQKRSVLALVEPQAETETEPELEAPKSGVVLRDDVRERESEGDQAPASAVVAREPSHRDVCFLTQQDGTRVAEPCAAVCAAGR
jgi:serine/threonine protein kinase